MRLCEGQLWKEQDGCVEMLTKAMMLTKVCLRPVVWAGSCPSPTAPLEL